MELDDAYTNAKYIPSGDEFPDRWRSASADFLTLVGARAELGIAFGGSDRQAYDLFHPEGPAQGTVVFIHGGYWRMLDAGFFHYLAAGPLARGWAVAMPGYDLCPDVRIADITRQVARGIEAIAGRTEGPLALTGHSAGGHLTARMLDPAILSAGAARRVTSAIPISPLADLRPLLKTSMNDDFRMDPESAWEESPVAMTERHPARITVWVGADERPVFLDQARWLAHAWNVALVVAPNRHHFDIIDGLADPESDLVHRLVT